MPYRNTDEQRWYSAGWTDHRRRQFFGDKACVECGETRYRELELDHVDPEQKVSHNIWSWSEERRNAELAKCQVLCRTCHRKKTSEYLRMKYRKPELHGRVDGYRFRKGCHCPECDTLRAKLRQQTAKDAA